MYVCVNDPHLQGLWRFEEVAGNRTDSSAHGNTLVDHNTVGSGTTASPQGERYASFSGGDVESLSLADADQHGLALTGDYSLSAWLRPNTGGYASFGIVDKRGNLGGGYQVYFSGGVLFVLHRNNWTDDYDLSDINLGGELPDDDTAWTHLVITYDADVTTVRYYINGQQVDSANDLNPPGDDHADFIVGPEPNGTYYTGYMDELAVFDRTLSAGDVQAIYLRHIRDVGPTVIGLTGLTASPHMAWPEILMLAVVVAAGLTLSVAVVRRPDRATRQRN